MRMPTIEQAQNKVKNVQFYTSGSLGISRSEVEILPLNTVQAMVGEYTKEFLKRVDENLKQSNSVSSGNLRDSVTFLTYPERDRFRVDYLVADYYKYVDQGVQGRDSSYLKSRNSPFRYSTKMPPVTAIEKWIIRNRLVATAKDVRKYGPDGVERKSIQANISRRTLAFMIAKSIQKKGIEATNFWTNAWTETFKDFEQKMAQALGNDIVIELQNMHKDVNNNKK
jgi:hypothetical protein